VQWYDDLGNPLLAGVDTLANQCAGDYFAEVVNAVGCTTIVAITINEPLPLLTNDSVVNASCAGVCDGEIHLTPSGGDGGPYTIEWLASGNTGLSEIALCAGTHLVVVTDNSGCSDTLSIDVTEPAAIVATTQGTNVVCNGSCDGTAIVVPSGGNAPFTFAWTGALSGAAGTNDTITGLCPDTYTVVITDANGCTFSPPAVIVTEPAVMTATDVITDVICNGDATGAIDVTVLGGVAPYTFTWSPGGAITEDLNNVPAGNYTLVVTDAGGCALTLPYTINESAPLSIAPTTTDATCGLCDGQATVVGSGGTGPYTYVWSNNATGASVSNLCAGTYTVAITDASGCVDNLTVTINNTNGPTVTVATTDPSCAGTCDGQATATVGGGVSPYTFNWIGSGGTTATETGLCAGTYTLEVIDAAGCITTANVVITDPSAIVDNATLVAANCGASDGSITVAPTGGAGGYTFAWLPPVSTSNTATSLPPGLYNLTITDASGCTESFSYTINGLAAPIITIAGTDLLCNGICTGAADATITGGTGPFTFQWTSQGVLSGTTEDLTALCAGDYILQVTDASGCIGFGTITINEADTFQIATNYSLDASCGGICDGIANVNPIGGTLGYFFAWTDGLGNPVGGSQDSITALCADTYTVTVTDASGCTAGPVSIVINEPAPLSATFNIVNANCGVADGSAEVIAAGGTPGYTYQWYDGLGNPLGTNPIQGSLGAGSYSVDVTDTNGCTNNFTVNVSNVQAPVIVVDLASDVSCFGSCDGAIDITVTGINVPFTYVWNPGGLTTEDISGLCPGTYTLEVTDTSGCIAFATVDILEPVEILATTTTTDATCGACNGTAQIPPTSGVAPYTYLWSSGGTGDTESGLCSGIYVVDVTDATGCTVSFSVSVNNLNGPTSATINSTAASCAGVCDGTVTVTPIGGTAPYSYYWTHNGATSNTLTNLCAGTYFMETTDASGCILVSQVDITEPAAMVVTPTIVPTTCGICDGSVSVAITNGVSPYTYAWSTSANTTPVEQNLCAGVITVTVTDANGCSVTQSIAVGSSNAPVASTTFTDVSCFGVCDGTIDASAVGGVAPYTFELFDANATSLLNGANATNLCVGDYTYMVTDNAGCVGFDLVTITEPDSITFSLPAITDVSCGGSCDGEATIIPAGGVLPYTFSWPSGGTTATESALCAGTFTGTVTDNNGCIATQDVPINEPAPLVITIDAANDPQCNTSLDGSIDISVVGGTGSYGFGWTGPGGPFATQNIGGLNPGQYIITVTDSLGCTAVDTVNLNAISPITADAGPDISLCEGTSITLVGTGGVTYEWYDLNGTLLIAGATYTTTPPLGSTSYVLVAYDGLCTDSDTVVVTSNNLPIADAGVDYTVPEGSTVTLGGNPTGPAGSIFAWSPFIFMDDSTLANPTVTADELTTYVVMVISPEGCIGLDTVLITPQPEIIFPNGISPNSDGRNDTWIIDYIDDFPDMTVEIFNRWGQPIFSSVGYREPWDGTYTDGKPVPVGTYYYVINLNSELYPAPYTGPITVLR